MGFGSIGGRVRVGFVAILFGVFVAPMAVVCAAAAGPAGRAPALATEGSGGGRVRWRLEGRRLRVVLPGPLVPGLRARPLAVVAQCGDDAKFTGRDLPGELVPGPVWAALASGRRHVAASASVVSVTLSSDVAGRTNLCTLAVRPGGSDERDFAAAMIVRRGRPRGCSPGPRERTIFLAGPIRVTEVRQLYDFDGESDIYRACLARAPLRMIEEADSGGDGGGSATQLAMFTSAGSWLAWTTTTVDYTGPFPIVRLLDLASPSVKPVTIRLFPARDGRGVVRSLAVAATGTVAWVLDPNLSDTDPNHPVQLQARKEGGQTITLDSASSVDLGHIAVSTDGKTVTWTNRGTQRSAALP